MSASSFLNKNSAGIPKLIAFFAALSVTGIHFSPALSSIGLMAAGGLALILFLNNKELRSEFPVFLLIPILLLVWQILASSFVSFNPGLNQKILIRLPFVLLPAFVVIKAWDMNIRLVWLSVIALFTCWLSLSSVVNYFLHFRFLNQMILESKPLPVYSIVYHIEFSVILAVTALSCLLFLHRNQIVFRQFGGQLLAVSTVLNILCLHVLSVRTGILCFWTGLLIYTMLSIAAGKIQPRVVLVAIAIIIGSAFLLPSVRNRIANTMDDLTSVTSGKDLNDKSFGQRWEAWRSSLFVIKNHPWFGVGLKNVEQALADGYIATGSKLDVSKRVMPHNQFLDMMVQSGIPAGILLVLFFVAGFWHGIRKKIPLLYSIMPALAFAMMFESLLERQSGVLVLVIFIPVALFFSGKDTQLTN